MVHISYFLIVVITVAASLCALGIAVVAKMFSLLEENKEWYERSLAIKNEELDDLRDRFHSLEVRRAQERDEFLNKSEEYRNIIKELKEKLECARLSERSNGSPQYTQITFAQKCKNIERFEIGMSLPQEEVVGLDDEAKIEMAKKFAEREAWRILEPRAMVQLDFDPIHFCDKVRFSWFINSDGEILGRDSFFDFSRNKG